MPLNLQSTVAHPDDTACGQVATPEDVVRLGADAFAVAAFVNGPTEAAHLRNVAECVHAAVRFEMPVVCHIYPRDLTGEPRISYAPEAVAWAVRCAVEMGVDVVKAPYCGDVDAHAQIVADCPVSLVAAGGPQAETLEAALTMMVDILLSGARGATIGRNIWGFDQITAAVLAFKAVIHDKTSPPDALRIANS